MPVLLRATAALLAVSLGYGVVVPVLPQLAGGGDAAGALSVVYAAYAAAKISAQVPGGAWVDARGARRVLRIALAAYTVSLAGFLVPGGPAWFMLVRTLEGAATGLAYPAIFAMAAGAREHVRGRDLGMVVGLGTSGLLLGPVLAAVCAPVDGRLALVLAVAVGVVATLVCPVGEDPVQDGSRRTVPGEIRAMGALLGDVVFVGAVLPVAFNKLTYSAMQGLLPLWGVEGLGLGLPGVTGLFVLTGVGFGVAQPLGGLLADRLPPGRVILGLAPVLLGALVIMGTVRDVSTWTVAYGGYVMASSMIFAATLKHAASRGGAGGWGGLYGLLGTTTDTMTVVGPLVFLNGYGALQQRVFLLMAGVGTCVVIAFAIFLRAGRRATS